jgi:hypothetical protein
MNLSRLTLTTLLAVGLAASAQSNGTDQILQVARATWPGSHTVGIVCDYSLSHEQVRALLYSFPPGSTVKVIDLRPGWDADRACSILANLTPDYILLLPDDPVVHDGSSEATRVITRMNQLGIPTLATTPAALSQGAWAAMGPDTGNALQVNPSLNGYTAAYGVPIRPSNPAEKNGKSEARAPLSVIDAF